MSSLTEKILSAHPQISAHPQGPKLNLRPGRFFQEIPWYLLGYYAVTGNTACKNQFDPRPQNEMLAAKCCAASWTKKVGPFSTFRNVARQVFEKQFC